MRPTLECMKWVLSITHARTRCTSSRTSMDTLLSREKAKAAQKIEDVRAALLAVASQRLRRRSSVLAQSDGAATTTPVLTRWPAGRRRSPVAWVRCARRVWRQYFRQLRARTATHQPTMTVPRLVSTPMTYPTSFCIFGLCARESPRSDETDDGEKTHSGAHQSSLRIAALNVWKTRRELICH